MLYDALPIDNSDPFDSAIEDYYHDLSFPPC